ncbi:MAG: WD40/YVTN/BNR-like repeat-containing protein, partial [Pyrinomonadaceae bacterium]
MTQAKDDPKTLFVGSTTGVWVSKNSGEDWTQLSSTSMPVNVNSLEVDPKKSSTIYAGTSWRPYKSTDSGKNWRLIKSGMIDDSDVFAITVNSKDNDHLFASACSGIYESLNGGDQWKKINGIPSTSRRTRAIVQHPSIKGTVFAGTTEGFWLSTTGGKSWSLTTQRNLEINSIAVHPDDPQRIYIATNVYGVMISEDGGKNFAPSNASFTSRFTYSVTADSSQPHRLYATTQNTASSGGFVFYSSDGGQTWSQSKGIDPNRVSPFTILQDRTTPESMLLGTNQGIYRSVDRGISWTLIEPPKPPVKKGGKGAATAKKGVAAAVKTTATVKKPALVKPVEPADAGPQVIPVLTEKVKVLAFTEDGKNGILAGTDNGLYRTYDIAKGWEKLPFGETLNSNVFVIYSTPLIPGTIWVGTASSGVIVSRDDGKTWERLSVVPDNTPVSSIAVDPKRPNNVYIGTIQTFYVSRDGGRNWSRRGGGLPLGNYTSILINPNNTDEMYISSAIETDGGIFYSEDAGQRWKRLDSKDMKIPSRRVWSMAFDPQDSKRIFAGSHSSGVYVIERRADTAKAAVASPSQPN